MGAIGSTPVSYRLLSRDPDGPIRKADWKYRTVLRMLGCLQSTNSPDIAMATHHCARFCIDPKLSHERAVKRIARYIRDIKDKGIAYQPDVSEGLECYVDADFSGG